MTDGARYARITDLTAAYAVLVDCRQAEAWADLFTEDGVLEFGGRLVKGRAALAEFAAGSSRGVHVCSPPTITEDAAGVTARSSFTFLPEDGSRLLAGRYTDLVRDDGRRAWFARRLIQITVATTLVPAGTPG